MIIYRLLVQLEVTFLADQHEFTSLPKWVGVECYSGHQSHSIN